MLHRCGTLPTLYCPLFMTFVPRQLNGRASDPCVKPWGCDRNKSPKLPSFQLLNGRAMTAPVFSLTNQCSSNLLFLTLKLMVLLLSTLKHVSGKNEESCGIFRSESLLSFFTFADTSTCTD